MAFLARFLTSLPLLILSPLLMAISACAMAVVDLAWRFIGKTELPADAPPRADAATVVIPNWNGRDLLARYLPDLELAMAGNESNEILVVDNGSSDGSVELLREKFPRVKVLALDRNLG